AGPGLSRRGGPIDSRRGARLQSPGGSPAAPRPRATREPREAMSLEKLVRAATERPLSAEEAESAFGAIMEGEATPAQIAALLVALRVRGAVADEVAGG